MSSLEGVTDECAAELLLGRGVPNFTSIPVAVIVSRQLQHGHGDVKDMAQTVQMLMLLKIVCWALLVH